MCVCVCVFVFFIKYYLSKKEKRKGRRSFLCLGEEAFFRVTGQGREGLLEVFFAFFFTLVFAPDDDVLPSVHESCVTLKTLIFFPPLPLYCACHVVRVLSRIYFPAVCGTIS